MCRISALLPPHKGGITFFGLFWFLLRPKQFARNSFGFSVAFAPYCLLTSPNKAHEHLPQLSPQESTT